LVSFLKLEEWLPGAENLFNGHDEANSNNGKRAGGLSRSARLL
jgi:hypothetical protein